MASTTEDVVVRYRAEVDQFTKELDAIILKQDEIIKNEVQQEKQEKKTVTAAQHAASKRKQLIIQEEAEIKKLRQLRALAFDPKQIEKYNKAIDQSSRNIATLGGKTAGLGKSAASVFGGIAAGIAAAFSVQAVIAFGKASINAFLEAEENATRLKFAITQVGGEGIETFDKLISQSEKLQKTTVFSDDQIQQAQTALASFRLTGDEIEKLIPKLADFATAAGTDIVSATQQVGAGLEGAGREFKKYNIEVSATASRQENLNNIMNGFTQFEGAAGEATKTLTGQLKQQANAADELQESIGQRLAPSFTKLKVEVFSAISAIVDGFRSLDSVRAEGVLKLREDTKERVLSGIVTEAEISRLTLLEVAKQEQLRIGDRLNDLQKEIVKNELQQNPQRLTELEKRRKALVLEAGVLKEIINEENNRLKIAKEKAEFESAEKEKKLAEERKKLREKELAEIKKNEDLLRKLRLDNIEDEKQQRIAAFEDQTEQLTANGQLRADILLQMERQLIKDLNEIDKKREVDPLFRVPKNVPQIPTELQGRPTGDISEPDSRNRVQIFLDENEQIISSTQELFNELASLSSAYADNRIEQINRTRDAELASLDVQQEAINKQLEKRRISETTAEALSEQLDQKRLTAEKKAADESRKIKRKAAILEKAAAIINITISTAEAVAKALTAGPYVGAVLAAIYGALGAAQAALVASQPIPYKKGSKKTRAGLSIVGEEGPELIQMPAGAKVLPAKQTHKYSDLIDAMFDNNIHQFVNYDSAPKLTRAKQKREEITQQSFAKNIAQSIIFNSDSAKMVAAINGTHKAGQRIVNVDELADAISKRISPDIYRR